MAISELKEKIKTIGEPRRVSHGNIRHRLDDIIIIGLCTIICLGEDYNDMEAFGNEREEWLRTFLELPNGIPDSDTFRRVFERLDPKELSTCLNDWLNIEREKRGIVAVDGKTIRGSGNSEHKAYHVVSAFVAENQITLGEIVVEEKSNEIKAVPELLDIIDVNGDIVTADAMSCQKEIAAKITERKADYVLALKDNQPALRQDVSDYFFSARQAPSCIITLRQSVRSIKIMDESKNVNTALLLIFPGLKGARNGRISAPSAWFVRKQNRAEMSRVIRGISSLH